MLPASAVPVKVGVVTLVMLSVLDTPLSDAASRSGADGAAGAMVSMVTGKAAEAALTLPATSVALAVMLWVPFARVDVVANQSPFTVVMPVPTWVVPSNRVTVLPASAVPVKVGIGDVGDVVRAGHTAVRCRDQIRDCRGRWRGLIEHVGLRQWRAERAGGVLDPRDQRVAGGQSDACEREGRASCCRGRSQPCGAVVKRHLHHVSRPERAAQGARNGLGGDVGDEVGGARSRVGREGDCADTAREQQRIVTSCWPSPVSARVS